MDLSADVYNGQVRPENIKLLEGYFGWSDFKTTPKSVYLFSN